MTNRTDNFNRADSATTIDSPSDGGGNYTIGGGGLFGISSNQGYDPATVAFQDQAVLESSVTAVETQVTISSSSGGGTGVINRYADTNNWIGGIWDSNSTLTLYKRVGGSYTVIQSTGSLTFSANDVMKLRSDSSDLHTLTQNGVSRCSGTEAAGSTNTKHGIFCDGTTSRRFEDLSITAIAAGAVEQSHLMMQGVS